MKLIEVSTKYEGPYSHELAEFAIDKTLQGADYLFIGSGASKVGAANAALELSGGTLPELQDEIVDAVIGMLPVGASDQEADNITHHCFCLLRVRREV